MALDSTSISFLQINIFFNQFVSNGNGKWAKYRKYINLKSAVSAPYIQTTCMTYNVNGKLKGHPLVNCGVWTDIKHWIKPWVEASVWHKVLTQRAINPNVGQICNTCKKLRDCHRCQGNSWLCFFKGNIIWMTCDSWLG